MNTLHFPPKGTDLKTKLNPEDLRPAAHTQAGTTQIEEFIDRARLLHCHFYPWACAFCCQKKELCVHLQSLHQSSPLKHKLKSAYCSSDFHYWLLRPTRLSINGMKTWISYSHGSWVSLISDKSRGTSCLFPHCEIQKPTKIVQPSPCFLSGL